MYKPDWSGYAFNNGGVTFETKEKLSKQNKHINIYLKAKESDKILETITGLTLGRKALN